MFVSGLAAEETGHAERDHINDRQEMTSTSSSTSSTDCDCILCGLKYTYTCTQI